MVLRRGRGRGRDVDFGDGLETCLRKRAKAQFFLLFEVLETARVAQSKNIKTKFRTFRVRGVLRGLFVRQRYSGAGAVHSVYVVGMIVYRST